MSPIHSTSACALVLFKFGTVMADALPLVSTPGQTVVIPSWDEQSTAKAGNDPVLTSQVGMSLNHGTTSITPSAR